VGQRCFFRGLVSRLRSLALCHIVTTTFLALWRLQLLQPGDYTHPMKKDVKEKNFSPPL
jgi:hypothetical protein